MTGAALGFTGVSVGYQGPPVLTGVDLHLAGGQRLALVGPNGAGKSTLIRTILGLTSLRSGTAQVYGRTPARARDLCGYVPQGDALDADFPVSAAQVVMMGRYRRIGWWRPARAADRRAVREALDRVGLADQAGRRFGLLSGGQRQRVLLARALAAEPRMLLLDEPFNGVDAVSKDAILGVLRASSATVVLSTHDLSLARDFADVVALVNGRLWECGPPAATLTTDHLRRAYGGHAVDLADGRTVLVEP